jgi:putative glutamine amidotransferase
LKDAAHQVSVEIDSLLHDVTGQGSLDVNSTHHQAVKDLGNGLMVSAVSKDGVVEAAEWIMKDRMPFLLLVQWHPERMEAQPNSPASKPLAEQFLKEVKLFRA